MPNSRLRCIESFWTTASVKYIIYDADPKNGLVDKIGVLWKDKMRSIRLHALRKDSPVTFLGILSSFVSVLFTFSSLPSYSFSCIHYSFMSWVSSYVQQIYRVLIRAKDLQSRQLFVSSYTACFRIPHFEPRPSFDHTNSSHLQNNFYGSSCMAINGNPTFAEFRLPSPPPSWYHIHLTEYRRCEYASKTHGMRRALEWRDAAQIYNEEKEVTNLFFALSGYLSRYSSAFCRPTNYLNPHLRLNSSPKACFAPTPPSSHL
ncbi:hypothetical protein GYMLUDRAFT_251389 [Collybiopsis luxurians FD-317 M1]|uniref:Uncharacterized protein n=1 Tax=Collybiopsis luxurians FD-317 M1 TaxID=944289 RepID=A0A0D0BCN1_9AGAR|nr:hypothetical protein GYMLUDRAFT_251389 [Collybiopsis luxurians FD-317 M1]